MTIELRRIQYLDPRAIEIRAAMDVEMGALYHDMDDVLGPELAAVASAAFVIHPDEMIATVGAFDGSAPDASLVGHAALRWTSIEGDDGRPLRSLEVKRVIVLEEFRGRGISRALMAALEDVSRELGCASLVLQTGPRQLAAIALYEAIGYERIPNFGLYAQIDDFLCFGKILPGLPAEHTKWARPPGSPRGLRETLWPGVPHEDDPEHPEDRDWARADPDVAAP